MSHSIDYRKTTLYPGFWSRRQDTVATVTLGSIEEQFRKTGRFDAFRFAWKEGMENQPHIFWDSDIAKWMETAAYVLAQRPDPSLQARVDAVVDLIEKHQEPSGYFNIYFTVVEPQARFTRRTDHELYCAGHLIEAAVAYYEATGKRKLLDLMCRYADHIYHCFVTEKTAQFLTPGHPEIELALVRLYRCTGQARYLELARFFLDHRGEDDPSQYYEWANALYAQDQAPVREQTTAEGHAVRATYLYAGMADVALEDADQALIRACRTLMEDIVFRKMYVTGGIGAASSGEGFSIPYDLPNGEAYSETCAAIGLAFFAQRMLLLDADSLYADVAERAMYNGALSGISLDGRAFFYENPLEIQPALREREPFMRHKTQHLPITQRLEVFGCSCCPPNITRMIASIGDFLYSLEEDCLYVHHYMASETRPEEGGLLRQETQYPHDGRIRLTVQGGGFTTVALRIPGWAPHFTLLCDGKQADYTLRKGYAYVCRPAGNDMTLELELSMELVLLEADPRVAENAGRVALQRGPIVYCLEAVDNGPRLRDLRILSDAPMKLEWDEALGAYRILAQGYGRSLEDFTGALYRPLGAREESRTLQFIPYYAFANRGESEMLVWVRI